jgi:hypothetical protein
MKKILFIIRSDPRTSPRPAEAVRIAAGINPWNKAQIDLLFEGPAILALDPFPGELIDGDKFTQYLPLVTENGGNVYLNARGGQAPPADPIVPVKELGPTELARLTSEHHAVNCF